MLSSATVELSNVPERGFRVYTHPPAPLGGFGYPQAVNKVVDKEEGGLRPPSLLLSDFLDERRNGDLPASRSIVVVQDASQVIGVNRQSETPRCSIGGDAPQKFLGVASGEVSVHGSIPYWKVGNTEALIILREEMLRNVSEVFEGVVPAVSVARRCVVELIGVVIVDLTRTLACVFGGVSSAFGGDRHYLPF